MNRAVTGYQFAIRGNNVDAVYEVRHGHAEAKTIEHDETWTFDGTNVIRTEMDDGKLETTLFSDANGDGLFLKTGKTYASLSPKGRHDNPHDDDRDDDDHDDDHDKHDDRDDDDHDDRDDHDDDHHPHFGNAPTNAHEPTKTGYQFVIDGNGSVTAVQEVKNNHIETEHIHRNESWIFDGLDVIQTRNGFGKIETTLYTDNNQDGLFQKDFEIEVLNGANPRALERYRFNVADGNSANGANISEDAIITQVLELGRRGWKVDRIDADETFQIVKIDTDTLILKTSQEQNGKIAFSLFRDDDGDSLWTEIAEGEAFSAFVDLDGQIDLVGIVGSGLLQSADSIVG